LVACYPYKNLQFYSSIQVKIERKRVLSLDKDRNNIEEQQKKNMRERKGQKLNIINMLDESSSSPWHGKIHFDWAKKHVIFVFI
jgi:hypothetical protein